MTALGDFIRQHRTDRNLTQAELARRVGINATYINAIETGRKRPDGRQLLGALAVALQLDDDGRCGLVTAAELSQRMLRLPEELSPAKHELVRALIEDLPHLGNPETAILADVLKGLRQLRTQVSMLSLASQQGGPM
ncbi:helix-turn-helix domain-containing protein [Cupriavidus sp. CuC1]|uniref:helix-turn-helix domain-containing protein n=1 Tax=Cupriavidus sp. CuC1 TaxID=3373131 RepID=UPI0037CCD822